MTTLAELAPFVGKILPGINWNALAAKNASTVYKTDYFYDYMLPAFEKADAIRQTLELTPAKDLPPAQAVEAWKMALKTIDKISGPTTQAASQGKSFMDLTMAFRMPVEAYRILIGSCWYTALYGATLHRTAAIHWAGVQWAKEGMSEQEVEARITRHAVLVTTLFQGLAKLDEFGALAPLKRKGLSGGFAIPLIVAGAVVIAFVGAILVLAWFVIAMKDTADRNRETEKICAEARTGDPTAAKICQAALTDPNRGAGTNPFQMVSDALTTVIWIGAAGMGAYALFLLWPTIMGRGATRARAA